ncbi:DNA-binding response regulator [Cryobacterium sp. PAMC25264]|uniref:DNA-binding response regulator n=1 Tax=Cryobacterium sp. PAMC25264 TaxID=2861288 RepID=UPI001C63068A|nr:DNA-binding response regulator [Cryobacterium sp. PAMC25264]QYF73747.1 DNA-binding response regulator [Cryobacterium sp. PAMC25264]
MTTRDDTAPIRLGLLDTHELLLDGMGAWIGQHAPDFDLVLTATTWADFVHHPNFPADLVVLDDHIAGPVSIEARVRTCRAAGANVVVVSNVDSWKVHDRARLAGATGYLTKDLSMAQFMEAARAVMGRPSRLEALEPLPAPPRGAQRPLPPLLSPGEVTAFRLYSAGHTTRNVAEHMGVQYETAKTYLRRVREKYAKVGRPASRRGDLIRRAAEDGYLT